MSVSIHTYTTQHWQPPQPPWNSIAVLCCVQGSGVGGRGWCQLALHLFFAIWEQLVLLTHFDTWIVLQGSLKELCRNLRLKMFCILRWGELCLCFWCRLSCRSKYCKLQSWQDRNTCLYSICLLPALLHLLLFCPGSDRSDCDFLFCTAGSVGYLPVYWSPWPVCVATRSSDRSGHQGVLGAVGGPRPCPHGGRVHPGSLAADINAGSPRSWWHYPCCTRISALCHAEVINFSSFFLSLFLAHSSVFIDLKLWKCESDLGGGWCEAMSAKEKSDSELGAGLIWSNVSLRVNRIGHFWDCLHHCFVFSDVLQLQSASTALFIPYRYTPRPTEIILSLLFTTQTQFAEPLSYILMLLCSPGKWLT